jgi:hypothetical protein
MVDKMVAARSLQGLCRDLLGLPKAFNFNGIRILEEQ